MGQKREEVVIVRMESKNTLEPLLYSSIAVSLESQRKHQAEMEDSNIYTCEGFDKEIVSTEQTQKSLAVEEEIIEVVLQETAHEKAYKRMKKAERERSDTFIDLTAMSDDDNPLLDYGTSIHECKNNSNGGVVRVKKEPVADIVRVKKEPVADN